jgi:hypothetical protein
MITRDEFHEKRCFYPVSMKMSVGMARMAPAAARPPTLQAAPELSGLRGAGKMRNGKVKMGLMAAVGAAMLWLCLAVPALAGPLEDGAAAYERKDYATALRLWRPLAGQGHARAQFHLGGMYDIGQGVPQDDAQAVAWYRKTADQGHADAQNNLGFMYGAGQGVPQDFVQAYLWSNLAAAALPDGDDRKRAVNGRDMVAARMTPAQLAEAQRLAREWKPE